MPSPTGWQKTVVIGLPSLMGAAFLVAWFTHGVVRFAAVCAYWALSVTLAWWLRRQVRRNDARAGAGRDAVS